jgi:CheY-like chemotaxis protein
VQHGLGQASAELTRIIIVDDDRFFVEMIRTALAEFEQFEVVATASNGAEAIERVQEYEPAVVLMDVAMPVLDGVEATRRIRELPSPPAVVLITSGDLDTDAAAYEAGASAYLRKAEDLPLLIGVLVAASLREVPI